MAEGSRPSSPEQNLWDSILNSVSTRRSIPSGNVLILGEPSTGKTTLANALLQRPPEASRNETGEWFGKTDFALGYQWANVKEEGEEGTLCRSYLCVVVSESEVAVLIACTYSLLQILWRVYLCILCHLPTRRI